MLDDPVARDEYRTRLYRAYATTHAGRTSDAGAFTELRHEIVPHLPIHRDARILDIGCGQGHLVRLLHELGYTHAAGVDVSAEQVEIARRNGTANVHQGELEEFLTASRDPWDAIVARDLLEHFDKPALLRTMDVIAGALRPGGKLVGRVPNLQSPFAGRIYYGDLTHGTGFTSRSIEQLCSATGFSEVAVYPSEPVPTGLKSRVRLVLWRMVALVMKAALIVETGVTRGHVVTQNLVFAAARASDASRRGNADGEP